MASFDKYTNYQGNAGVSGVVFGAEKAVLEDEEDGRVSYYRDEENIHHVPKRKLKDIII